jgi:hypothetical protein
MTTDQRLATGSFASGTRNAQLEFGMLHKVHAVIGAMKKELLAGRLSAELVEAPNMKRAIDGASLLLTATKSWRGRRTHHDAMVLDVVELSVPGSATNSKWTGKVRVPAGESGTVSVSAIANGLEAAASRIASRRIRNGWTPQ